nr:MAG TPA: hypothetical protein [Caudoviricetes sp.]
MIYSILLLTQEYRVVAFMFYAFILLYITHGGYF